MIAPLRQLLQPFSVGGGLNNLQHNLTQLGPAGQAQQPNPLAPLLESNQKAYKLLSKIPMTVGRGSGPYQSEVYQPWSEDNPTPGKFHIELRHYLDQPQSAEDISHLMIGETFHHLGTRKPDGQPVDPQWYGLKQKVFQTMAPHDLANEQRNWKNAQAQGDTRSFDDWVQESMLDQYIGGVMFPLSNEPEWVKRSQNLPRTNPQQSAVIEQMRQYLTTGQPPTGE
jgi:hypothetical protein